MSARLAELDRAHVWHPFTQMADWAANHPLVIERGAGSYLFDTAGRRYLDGVSSLWTIVHGHNHPHINRAITDQLAKVAHTTLLGAANIPSIELAARLVAAAPPGLKHVFYSDSGSTAVEIALKQAYQYWQLRGRPTKRRFLHLKHAYHGDTLGAVGVGGIPLFHEVYGPLVQPGIAVPAPHPYRHALAARPAELVEHCLGVLARTLAEHADDAAAFILEPRVQGAAGIWVHAPGYLRGAAELCRQHDVLLIADEVATGFGRTGLLFACEHEGVTPDLMCLAKGLSGGYLPLAATLSTPAVFETFLGDRATRTFFHGHTFTGNPLACAAALASLELFEREKTLDRVAAAAAHLAELLADRIAPHPAVGEIRQLGLMVGIELVADRSTGAPLPAAAATGAKVCLAARRHGVLLRPLGDVVVLMPPLSISNPELDELVTALAAALAEVA